uniref:Nucleoplasmin-like domain-containing protein n=1 Tax=Daphnia galeata TaxID=27404 RepID=A0A8J2WNH3_9CRUS|nr:unnamed protein product [Daphnia galeata]
MFSPGRFSDCKRFWGIQLEPSAREKQIRVNSDTKLHISNILVDFRYFSHEANCSVSIGVRYETDRCDCNITKQSCSSHSQQQQSCVIGIIKQGQKSEAELDLNFVVIKILIPLIFLDMKCVAECILPYGL